jgi:hypothetical protein
MVDRGLKDVAVQMQGDQMQEEDVPDMRLGRMCCLCCPGVPRATKQRSMTHFWLRHDRPNSRRDRRAQRAMPRCNKHKCTSLNIVHFPFAMLTVGVCRLENALQLGRSWSVGHSDTAPLARTT